MTHGKFKIIGIKVNDFARPVGFELFRDAMYGDNSASSVRDEATRQGYTAVIVPTVEYWSETLEVLL